MSTSNGLNEATMKRPKMCGVAGLFAAFQFAMPMIGWICVCTVAKLFGAFEKMIPWIALILLCYIGGKMLIEGIKNKDSIKAFWQNLKEEIGKPSTYSSKWFETVTDEVLSNEREKVRLAYCCSGENFSEACRLERLLGLFDKEMGKRAWAGKTPCSPTIHREHGWYLPNDD